MKGILKNVRRIALMACVMTTATTALAQQAQAQEPVMTKAKGTYVINTTTLCNTRGFKGETPLKVTIKKNKVVSVEALSNQETPRFFDRLLKEMFPKYENVSFADADKVDIVTGATRSSKAVKDNVKAAVEYYQKNK